MSAKVVQLRQDKKQRNATSRSKGRQGNNAYRVREHLTEVEVAKLLPRSGATAMAIAIG
jgi:hypothetical protein